VAVSFACYGWCRTRLGVGLRISGLRIPFGARSGCGCVRIGNATTKGPTGCLLAISVWKTHRHRGSRRPRRRVSCFGRKRSWEGRGSWATKGSGAGLGKRTRMSGTTVLAGRCFALLRGRHAMGMQFVLSGEEKRWVLAERV
jgi:hypothetical protein